MEDLLIICSVCQKILGVKSGSVGLRYADDATETFLIRDIVAMKISHSYCKKCAAAMLHTCTREKDVIVPHPCPYKVDVGRVDPDEESDWCTCCEARTQQCTDDI